LLIRASHRAEARRRVASGLGAELEVEQRKERLERRAVALLLEQRPAVLVERLLVECGRGPALEHAAIRVLGFGVAARDEERLTATEVRLVVVDRVGVLRHEPVERRERGVDVAARLVRARELIKHEIVLRVARMALEK